jgi:hypothetical protein
VLGPLTLLNTTTTAGNISLNYPIVSGGLFTVENDNLSGSISVADSLNIAAGNGVVFSSGPPPSAPVPGTKPPGVTANTGGGFNAFFGNGLTAAGPVTINALTNNVVFNGSTGTTISLGTGVTISAASLNPPPAVSSQTAPQLLSSLPPQLFLYTGNLGLPSTTVIATDKTPQSNPQKSGDLGQESQESSQMTALASATRQLPGLLGNITFFKPGFDTADVAESIIKLPSGNGLFIAGKDLNIQVSFGSVSVKAGSAVLIIQTGQEVAIFNLHDDHRGAVTATISGTTFDIPIGRQLVVTTNSDAAFDRINPSTIGYRGLSSAKLKNKKVYTAEFAQMSALTMISRLLNPQDRKEKAIADRMLKSTAAMYLLGMQARKPGFKPGHQ